MMAWADIWQSTVLISAQSSLWPLVKAFSFERLQVSFGFLNVFAQSVRIELALPQAAQLSIFFRLENQ